MKPQKKTFHGPALFSGGFRPFFLAATLFALCVVPAWYLVWRGDLVLRGPFAPTDWHMHEMVFGYGAAVLAGFLFTAVPNWTGRMPTRGWPLALLLALWLAGRAAMFGGAGLGAGAVMALDLAFLLAVAVMIGVEIVAGRNWRNLKVLVPVSMFWAANLAFHLEVMKTGIGAVAPQVGVAVLVFLIALIGGRIVPSFTRNWMVREGHSRLPTPFGRFDGVALLAGALALAAWCAFPAHPATSILALLAAGLHLARLARWRGWATWRAPILLMLHLAYLMLPASFVAAALAAGGHVSAAVPAHLFGIGAIGGMTVAVMMRATMGHTGRALAAGPVLTGAFALVMLAGAARVAGAQLLSGADPIAMSAALWTAGFALLAWRLGPWLALPAPAARRPSPVPRAG